MYGVSATDGEGFKVHTIANALIRRLVNVASLAAAMSLWQMSNEMSTKFKNTKTLEEVDGLMASFIGYVRSHCNRKKLEF